LVGIAFSLTNPKFGVVIGKEDNQPMRTFPLVAGFALALASATAYAQTATTAGCTTQKAAEGDSNTRPQKAGEGEGPVRPSQAAEGDSNTRPQKAGEGDGPIRPSQAAEGDSNTRPQKAAEGDSTIPCKG
jgi:hypothetical protein